MDKSELPASKNEIMERLEHLLGIKARNVVQEAAKLHDADDIENSLVILTAFDQSIGGFGLHSIAGKDTLAGVPGASIADRDIYRPIQYIRAQLSNSEASFLSRHIVAMACVHVEGVLKRLASSGFLGEFRYGRLPMGALLRKRFENRLSQNLYSDLLWLNDDIYRFAKHEFGPRLWKQPEESYFDLDEAIAIYFIARYLVVQLPKWAEQ